MNKLELMVQKRMLKNVRNFLKFGNNGLAPEFKDDLVTEVNILIGRVNCDLTEDAKELDRLAIEDDIRCM